MKKQLKYILLTLSPIIFMASCSEDDGTGNSLVVPTSPSLSVSLGFTNNQTLIESEEVYPFTITISEPQAADVVVKLEQTAGTATDGDDFTFPHQVTIEAGKTSASGEIAILEDELIEDTETATIKIGTGNVGNVSSVSSQTVTFNIMNLTTGDLAIALSWAASSTVTDNAGNEIDATDLANMRLFVVDNIPYTTVIAEADEASFEALELSADTPDGEYYIIADFSATHDIKSDIDLTVTYDQIGEINGESYTYDTALHTSEVCADNYFVLSKITKTGDNYTIEEVGEVNPAFEFDITNFVGTWEGTTSFGHETQVVTTLLSENQLQITGIGVGFMEEDWGEVITDQQTLTMDVNTETGEFTISETYYMTTTYEGDVQPVYNLVATGMLSGKCIFKMDLDYDFIQDGTSYTEWLTVGNGYPPFEEHITLSVD